MEYKLQQEEEEVREAVRKKKLNGLEASRRKNRVLRIKEDQRIQSQMKDALDLVCRPSSSASLHNK